ncbi:MAG: hypothetical protein QW666_01335 [Candidatus Woesearchaeota archaeon]
MSFDAFKRSLNDLSSALDNLTANNLTLEKPAKSAAISDFKKNQDDYFRSAVLNGISFVENSASKLDVSPEYDAVVGQIKAVVKKLGGTRNVADIKFMVNHLASLASQIKSSESPKFSLHQVPVDIQADINADFVEMQKCYSAGCYRSVVILCGRLLETAIHRLYFDMTGIDLLEKSPNLGLGNLIAKLKERSIELDPALTNQIHLINQVRVYSVHTKKDAFSPSKEQAHAIMLYTIDSLNKIFKR